MGKFNQRIAYSQTPSKFKRSKSLNSPDKPQVDKAILKESNTTAAKAQAVAKAIVGKRKAAPRRSQCVFLSENPETSVDLRNFYRRVYLPKVEEMGLDGVTAHVAAYPRPSIGHERSHGRHDCGSVETVRSSESIPLTRGGGEGGEVREK